MVRVFIEREEKKQRMSRRKGSGFSSASTAEQVTEGIDATALTAIVTGLHFFFLNKTKIRF